MREEERARGRWLRARSAWAVSVCALALAGCLPDLGRWEVVPAARDGEISGLDAGGALRDGGPSTRVDAGPRTGGPCASPEVSLAAHDLTGGPGRVLRWELRGADLPRPCSDLTGRGDLDAQPFAIVALDESFLLVASRSGVQALSPLDDRMIFDLGRSGVHPNDAFALDDPAVGDRVSAVAWSNLGGSAEERGPIRTVETFTRDGAMRRSWQTSAIGTGLSTSMTASPVRGAELLAMNAPNFAAAEVDPYAGIRRDPALVPPIADTYVTSLSAGRSADGTERLAWTAMTTAGGAAVLSNDVWALAVALQPATCEGTPCRMVHAAVDPSLLNGMLAICERGDGRRALLRFDFSRSVCETFLDFDAAPGLRPSYLAVRE